MLSLNIQNYLEELFLSVNFPQEQVKKKIALIEGSFQIAVVARVLDKISAKQQAAAVPQLKAAKTPEKFLTVLMAFFGRHLTKENLQKIYTEELEKILEKILKPLPKICTPEQLKKLHQLTEKYL